jgi:hypothetical protein
MVFKFCSIKEQKLEIFQCNLQHREWESRVARKLLFNAFKGIIQAYLPYRKKLAEFTGANRN